MLIKVAFVLIALLPLTGVAQTDPVEATRESPSDAGMKEEARSAPSPEAATPSTPSEGLWPSRKLMRSMLLRWADEVSRQYELDDEQRVKMQQAVTQRWEPYLTENRAAIQPVLNEFVEMRMDLEPPGKEQVQAWADRAMPIFEQAREQITAGTEEFREILEPRQRAKFELDALKFGIGLQAARHKLGQWREGTFDPVEFWEPTPSVRHERREDRRRREAEAIAKVPPVTNEAEETDQISLELDAWDKYVREFVKIFNLDEGQRTTASSVLTELKGRAEAHRDRRRSEIADLEHRISTFTGSKEEAAELKRRLAELYGPIDEMFQDLKSRIEPIPTERQRAGAGKEEEKDE